MGERRTPSMIQSIQFGRNADIISAISEALVQILDGRRETHTYARFICCCWKMFDFQFV